MRSPRNKTNVAGHGRYMKRASRQLGVRDQGQIALASTKSAYRRITKAKSPARALLNDKKVRRDLRRAVRAIEAAAVALSASPRMRTRDALALGAALSLLGGGLVFVRSEKFRAKLLSKARGADGEFKAPFSPADTPVPPPGGAAAA